MTDDKNGFELKIIKPTTSETFSVEWLDVQTPTGNFVVGPNHDDLVSILKEKGSLIYKKVGEDSPIQIDLYEGFLKIQDNKVILILEL